PGLGATVATEIVAVYDATFQRSLLGAEVLTGHRHPIVVQHAKRIEIWAREGRLGHVEVFLQMCCFSTSIIERPRHFLCLQHTPVTKPIYTQKSEEPIKSSTAFAPSANPLLRVTNIFDVEFDAAEIVAIDESERDRIYMDPAPAMSFRPYRAFSTSSPVIRRSATPVSMSTPASMSASVVNSFSLCE